jgi:Bacterial Ig-like domain (group 2)
MNETRLEIVFTNALQIVSAPPPAPMQRITVIYAGLTLTVKGDYVMYTLPVDHLVRMQVAYVDAAGHPATVDGDVVWNSSNPSIAAVDVDDADSTIVTVTPAGALGQVQITATADADLGQGVRQLITTADVEVVAGEAVAGTISPVGAPEPI